ncbi:hypothetical protein BSR29_06340 [Boudabousia liubingyangii]|uniref:Lipoprotein n=1 Tax=Boudabousia liubingyangii TaxID=1921764 RepID=A0A1Q5PKR7_9ACTO|nr:hypothetical protein [Boudabousia liubingyangii]OKL47233.1 hypothetical protein BSR29_06340 [Boudabousia liubingyangii]
MKRKTIAAAAAALSISLLGACSASIPAVTYDEKQPVANLNEAQAERILSQTTKVMLDSAANKDIEALKTRLSGAALAMRTAQYQVAKATNTNVAPVDLSTDILSDTIGPAYPRGILNISKGGEGQLPTISLLRTENSLENYKLSNYSRLFSGVTVPSVPKLKAGVPLVAPTATGYRFTPRDAVTKYVAYLSDQSGKEKDTFETDPFAEFLKSSLTNLKQAANQDKDAVEVTLKVEADDNPITAVQLNNSDALVFASVKYTLTMKVKLEGTKLRAPEAVVPFLGADKAESTGLLSITSVASVVLLDPAKDKSDKLKALGAETVVVGAENKPWQDIAPANPTPEGNN